MVHVIFQDLAYAPVFDLLLILLPLFRWSFLGISENSTPTLILSLCFLFFLFMVSPAVQSHRIHQVSALQASLSCTYVVRPCFGLRACPYISWYDASFFCFF